MIDITNVTLDAISDAGGLGKVVGEHVTEQIADIAFTKRLLERIKELEIENEITAQERACIRALIAKGCDAVAVTELFGLRDGELCEICEED